MVSIVDAKPQVFLGVYHTEVVLIVVCPVLRVKKDLAAPTNNLVSFWPCCSLGCIHLKQCCSASQVVLQLDHPGQALCEQGATLGHRRHG
jgi:hypothetical protein